MSLNELKSIGVDIDDALERFMNNEMLFKKFFKKLLNDNNFTLLQEAFKNHNIDDAISYAHTLKGVCGNLAIKPLYHLFDEIVKALRSDNWDVAIELNDKAISEYTNLLNVIKAMD